MLDTEQGEGSLLGPGTYRIVHRIDEAARIVHVRDIDHRSDIYHQPKA